MCWRAARGAPRTRCREKAEADDSGNAAGTRGGGGREGGPYICGQQTYLCWNQGQETYTQCPPSILVATERTHFCHHCSLRKCKKRTDSPCWARPVARSRVTSCLMAAVSFGSLSLFLQIEAEQRTLSSHRCLLSAFDNWSHL